MKERMSIANRCFLGMRSAFDQALEGTVQRMLDMHAGECSVAIKLNIELMGVDGADRIVPDCAAYQIQDQHQHSHEGRFSSDIEGPDPAGRG